MGTIEVAILNNKFNILEAHISAPKKEKLSLIKVGLLEEL